jgi:hypothetical protein
MAEIICLDITCNFNQEHNCILRAVDRRVAPDGSIICLQREEKESEAAS